MKKITGILLAVMLSLNGFSQGKLYKYEVEKKVYVVDSLYDCIESEFEFKRSNYSVMEFCDHSFYSNGRDTLSKKSDSFKIVKGNWFIKKQNTWKYFFSMAGFNSGKSTPSCYFIGNSYLVPYKKMKGKDSKTLYVFRLNPKEEIDNLYYVFDPSIGFVSMDVGRCSLVLISK